MTSQPPIIAPRLLPKHLQPLRNRFNVHQAELGTTLRAAGFTPDHLGKGGSWHRPSSGRIRPNQNNTAPKQRWTRQLCPSRRKTTSSSSEARKTSPGRPTELPLFDETSNA